LRPVKEGKQLHLQKLTLKDPPFRHGRTLHKPADVVVIVESGNTGAIVVIDVSQN
jgi:hypothetical protein